MLLASVFPCALTSNTHVRDERNVHKAHAAGAIEAVVTAISDITTTVALDGDNRGSELSTASWLLVALVWDSKPHMARAVRAGALEVLLAAALQVQDADAASARNDLIGDLRAAAARHDAAGACAHADCARCAAMRARGAMCALPGCCARTRADGKTKLLRCGSCDAAWYCGAPHQRNDWARHRDACRARADAEEGDAP
jgi:hypothetical protein